MQGYIKLYRKLMDSPIWSDPHYLKLWIYCLLKATHKERKVIIGNKTVTLYPGQFITGRKTLADDLNEGMKPKQQLSESTWWRYLNNLEDWGMLNIKKTNKFSVISILKWLEYQESEQHLNIKKTDSFEIVNRYNSETEHQKNNETPFMSMDSDASSYETEHQMNNKWTSDEHQMNTNKNDKNDKKIYKDDDLGACVREYEMAFGFPSPMLVDEFDRWINNPESQFVEPMEIIIEVIKRAQKQMPRNPARYISQILRNLHNMQLYTLEAVKEYNKNFDEKLGKGGGNNGKVPQHGGGYGRPATKTLEQVLREADEARKAWGG